MSPTGIPDRHGNGHEQRATLSTNSGEERQLNLFRVEWFYLVHVTECLWPHFYASVYGMLVKLCLVVSVFLYTLCCLGEQFLLRSMGM